MQQQNKRSWLWGLLILMGAIALIEAGIILQQRRSLTGHAPGLWQKIMPPPSQLQPPRHSENQFLLWDSAADIKAVREQINNLFFNLAGPGAASRPPLVGTFRRAVHPAAARDQFFRLQEEIDRIFEGAFRDLDTFSLPARLEQGWQLGEVSSSLNLTEEGSNYVVRMTWPDLDPADIAINLQGRLLSISIETAAGPEQGRRRQHLESKLMLPGPVEGQAAQAIYREGILRVAIPKSAAPEQPLVRHIKLR